MAKNKLCRNCKKPVDKNAIVCTSCGVAVKKPIYKKWWFWLIAVIVVFFIAVAGSDSENTSNNTQSTENVQTTQTEQPPEADPIVYEVYNVSQLVTDLDENALKAEDKYKNKYVEITGELSTIDSDGAYISLAPENGDFTLTTVQCYIKNDEQKAKIMELTKGDIITIKGKIKSIGELLGYSLDIDSIN